MEIDQRVAYLERHVRHLRIATVGAVFVSVGALAISLSPPKAATDNRPAPAQTPQLQIDARNFRVVDASGNVAAILGANEHGVSLALFESNNVKAVLHVDTAGNPTLDLIPPKSDVFGGSTEIGTGILRFFTKEGYPQVLLAGNPGEAELLLHSTAIRDDDDDAIELDSSSYDKTFLQRNRRPSVRLWGKRRGYLGGLP